MFALYLLSEGGESPNTSLTRLLYIGIAFFFLMIIVGWWVSSKKQDQPEVQHEAAKPRD